MSEILQDKAFIYGLKDPRDNVIKYIGKTNRLKHRLSQHCREKGNNRKCNWIKSLKKLGLKPEIELIDEVLYEDWQNAEISYIRLFKSFGAKLYNEKSGGEGGEFSLETRKKIADKQKKKSVFYSFN